MQVPRIKICGITCPQQARDIAELGVDAIGLIVGAESKRKITLPQANEIIQTLPVFIAKVALIVNQSAETVHEIINQLDIDYIQFHGDESADFCNQFNFPYIRCIRVKEQDTELLSNMENTINHGAKAVLLDAWDSQQYGGTGKQIKSTQQISPFKHPVILAGGINPDNAVAKIKEFQPYALDVNSGVEISPGNKDIAKVRTLMKNVRSYSLNSNTENNG